MNFETAEVTYEKPHRLSGILLHPTSCPSPYGIGDLGQDAYDFVIFLKNQDNTYGRSFHLRRPVLGIRRIKAFQHLQDSRC